MQIINLKPGKLYRSKQTRSFPLCPTKFGRDDPRIIVKENSILMFIKYGGRLKIKTSTLDFTQPTGIFLTEDGKKIESSGLVVYTTAFLEEAKKINE